MRVHRTLAITGTRATLDGILANMASRATGDWSRNRPLEEEVSRGLGPMYCFECRRKGDRPHARAWLGFGDEGRRLWLANVLPCEDEGHSLSMAACNTVVTSLHEDLILPATADSGVQVELGPELTDLSPWLDARTLKLLEQFVGIANKNTGASHPSDQKRWFAFLIAAHRDKADLDASTLGDWLRKDGQFPADIADDLAIQYETGRALLAVYDQAGTGSG